MSHAPVGAAAVRAALAARGWRPAKRFGQHFLTDPALLARIAAAAGVGAGDVVLEVGSGPGTLTAALLARGAAVVAVEVDPRMIAVLHDVLGAPPALTVVEADVLCERPELPAAVRAALAARGMERGTSSFVLAANLPYEVASTLLVDLWWRDAPPARGAVTVQDEVARRLAAGPRDQAYGPLSVLVQLRARVERAFRLAPGSFWPPPRVASACVRLETLPPADRPHVPRKLVFDVVHAVFRSRRKSLENSLRLAFRDAPRLAPALAWVAEKKAGKRLRGEELAPMEILELAAAVHAAERS